MTNLPCDLGVASLVIQAGKVLLVQEAKGRHSGLWGLPKGRVESNETVEAAALRELKEETGREGVIQGLVGVRTTLRDDGPAVFLCFDVAVLSTASQPHDEEISHVAWFSLAELQDIKWISETMYQLALDGLLKRKVLLNQPGLTSTSDTYCVYRVGQLTMCGGGAQ